MMRCTQTLILFLALLLTSCTAAPMPPMRTAEILATVALTATAAPSPAPTATPSAAVAAPATATATPVATLTSTPSSTATPAPIRLPSPAPTPTATPEGPMVTVTANANLRAGPGIAYPVTGSGRAGQALVPTGRAAGDVAGRSVSWWRTPRGWIAGSLVTANAAAQTVPLVTDVPPPPTVEVENETEAQPAATPTTAAASLLPDLVVLGADTQYPVRARVLQGWGYEFVDLSTAYDIVVYRDVFGMLAHQIDDENVRRYGRQSRFARYGPLRITLVDAQPHPDPACPGWGWAPDRDTFVDPYGMTREPCRVEHSLFPQGDGAGTTLLIGWGYTAGTTLAIGTAGPHLGDLTTSFFAEALPWPGNLGPADRPDFSQPLYQPLGAAYTENGRWGWRDPFAEVVPAGR